MLDKAIRIAAQAFEGKFDKGGHPYILHCLHVMNEVRHLGTDYAIVGVLHDLIEDTEWTFKMLVFEGFSPEVITALVHMTHESSVSYDEYIQTISNNDIAIACKRADLKHNSDITRMKGLRKKDFDRLAKYHRAYEYLKE